MNTTAKKISVLGTDYTIRFVESGQNEYMDRMNYGGLCDGDSHEIFILLLKTCKECGKDPDETIEAKQREIIRHELVHAFLNESGLRYNSLPTDGAWAKNEEMVDWFAIQFPKMLKAFQQADAL